MSYSVSKKNAISNIVFLKLKLSVCFFKKLYEDVLTISLKCLQEYILRIFTLSSARDCFQYVLYKKYNILDTIYVTIMTKYTPEYTKLQHL